MAAAVLFPTRALRLTQGGLQLPLLVCTTVAVAAVDAATVAAAAAGADADAPAAPSCHASIGAGVVGGCWGAPPAGMRGPQLSEWQMQAMQRLKLECT